MVKALKHQDYVRHKREGTWRLTADKNAEPEEKLTRAVADRFSTRAGNILREG